MVGFFAELSLEVGHLDKMFLEMQKNLPKNFAGERQKCLKLEKISSLSAGGAATFCLRRTNINSLIEKKSDILRKVSYQSLLYVLYVIVGIKPL